VQGNNGEAGRPNNLVADGRARALEAVSGVSSSLKTLFQRHPSASQPVPGPARASLDPNLAEPGMPDEAAPLASEADAALLENLGLGAGSPRGIKPATPARPPGSGVRPPSSVSRLILNVARKCLSDVLVGCGLTSGYQVLIWDYIILEHKSV
jgi:hypothetical protein